MTKSDPKYIRDLYAKLRQSETLTGDECRVLEDYEAGVLARSAARAAVNVKPRAAAVIDLNTARAMWAGLQVVS